MKKLIDVLLFIPLLLWNIFAYLVVSILLFFTFVVLHCVIFFGGKKSRILYKIPGFFSRITLLSIGITTKVRNENRLNTGGPCVFVCNHSTNLDFLLGPSFNPYYKKFLGKAELLKTPVIGYVLRNLYVSVKRKDAADRHSSFKELGTAIDENFSIFIFPEGTRNKGKNHLRPFYDGAFRLAIEKKVPVICITVYDASEKLAPRKLFLKPGIVHCHVSKPYHTTQLTNSSEDIKVLKEKIRNDQEKRLQSFWSKT